MMNIRHLLAIVREAFASAKASPIASIATILMVSGMCATVLLTTGRTVGAENAVLSSIDSAGTRAIVVRANDDAAGLDTTVLDRIRSIEGIEWFGAFGSARDATNALVPDGIKVATRLVYTSDFQTIGMTAVSDQLPGTAWVTELASSRLGLQDSSGAVLTQSGEDFTVVGKVSIPTWLNILEPVVLIPTQVSSSEPVAILVVIAERPELVTPVSRAVQSVLALEDPSKATLSTSEKLAELRSLVQGQLGSFSRSLVLIVLTVSALLVAAILVGFVTLRRRDFGRRRALGATRSLIVWLLLTQTFFLASFGAAIGITVTTLILTMSRDPLPGFEFTISIGILGIFVSLLAAVIPAIVAARRDPIRELRVP